MDLCYKFSNSLQMFYDDGEAKKDLFDHYHDMGLIRDIISDAEDRSLVLFSDRSILEVGSTNEIIKLTPISKDEAVAIISHEIAAKPRSKTLDLLKMIAEEAEKRGGKLPPDLDKLMEQMKTC